MVKKHMTKARLATTAGLIVCLLNACAALPDKLMFNMPTGSLEPGKWADYIVVDRDFFEIPESEIDDIQVLQTWVGGELVYERCEDANSADCVN